MLQCPQITILYALPVSHLMDEICDCNKTVTVVFLASPFLLETRQPVSCLEHVACMCFEENRAHS